MAPSKVRRASWHWIRAHRPVLFNYRYNPVHWKVEEVISSGAIGNVKSVHFEWLLVSAYAATGGQS